ncbi:MAG: hypothetical protein M5R36_23225 [Deltaproteobacteria bacterium]|nr:hypothetical protein [Deltaproteobacteria bacterium]
MHQMWKALAFLALMLTVAGGVLACGGDDDDDNNDDAEPDDDADDDVADDDVDDDVDDDADDDADDDVDDDDDSGDDDDDVWPYHLLPGPDEPGFNAELEDLARLYDRQFHVFNAAGTGLNMDVTITAAHTEDRELVRAFLQESDGWDFEAYSGKSVFDVVTAYQKVAGLYAGVGIAADAFRYGILRDQGYDAAEVEIARQHLEDALEALYIAYAITGTTGVIARGYNRLDIPGPQDTQILTPLFDEFGDPLPPEKNNGTWRADNSGGDYPNYIWEDSCSRDQFIGWCAAFGGAWEVIKNDDGFSQDLKDRLQTAAKEIALSLKVVRDSGFDLEIWDADERTTFHGYMNENAYDRIYLPWLPIKDGMYAGMALGCVAALAYAAEDPEVDDYLYNTLIAQRGLDLIIADNQMGVDLWLQSNYSGVNMAFMGFVLAMRYVDDESAQENLRFSMANKLYDKPDWPIRQPIEQKMSMYDFIYAAGMAGSSAFDPMFEQPDQDAVDRGVETLLAFDTPPYWSRFVENCDDAEEAAFDCIGIDGVTHITPLGPVGRKGTLVAVEPIPKAIRRPSNFEWRSNPYEYNGGGSESELLPGVDFRWAYWLGRWSK